MLEPAFLHKKDWKILDMDYSSFASPEGNIRIEKAHVILDDTFKSEKA